MLLVLPLMVLVLLLLFLLLLLSVNRAWWRIWPVRLALETRAPGVGGGVMIAEGLG